MERSLELGNVTRIQEFVLLGLSTSPETREILFAIFLTLYLLTLLENALIMDGGAWWAAVYGVTQRWTRLK